MNSKYQGIINILDNLATSAILTLGGGAYIGTTTIFDNILLFLIILWCILGGIFLRS